MLRRTKTKADARSLFVVLDKLLKLLDNAKSEGVAIDRKGMFA